jgi:hypothetical protein
MSIDPELLRQLKERASINRAKRAKPVVKDARKAPIVYVPTGTTLLRFYMDSENNITRTLFRHKARKNSVHCLTGCPVCKYLSEMEKKYPDFPGTWKLRSMETSIVYAWIFSSSEESKFVKIETPVLLMGNYKLGRELNDHIADIDEEDFARMLDPLSEHALWELKCGNNGKDFSLAPSFKTGTMDPLPDTLYPLSQCIHPEGQAPNEEEISRFIEKIDVAYEMYLIPVRDSV